jgi:16S rRNA (uracil1498-N3)-methyltransferase
MRVRIGEEVELVNGRGSLATATVLAITKHNASLAVLSTTLTPLPEPKCILAIPLMRLPKLELIIEKCTELGADAFWLYPAHHSEKDDLSPNQFERLTHIAISAMKQCGRLDLPPIKIHSHFQDLFGKPYKYLFGDTRPDAPKFTAEEKIVFITGPEKGFSEKEVNLLEKSALGVRLNKNILRAETAPIAATCLFS